MPNTPIVHVYFLMLPNNVLLDSVGPAEAFQYANRVVPSKFELHFIGPDKKVKNTLGLKLEVDALPAVIESNNWIISAGLAGDCINLNTPSVKKTVQWLDQQSHVIKRYISICSGVLLFAKAGLLTAKSCTTHHMHLNQLRTIEPSAKVLENRLFVVDDNFYSSAGVTSGIDLALYLIQQECGADCAADVARHMLLFSRRGPHDPAESVWLENRNHLHQSVHRVQDAVQADPTRQWSLEVLAELAQCSSRHLVRVFKSNTGISTREYIHRLRLALALQLLQTTSLTIEDIAQRCGFDDPRQFRRIWSRHHALPPSHFRNSGQP